MFVVLITYVKPMTEIEATTAEHRAWVDQQVAENVIIAGGPKVPRTGGVLIFSGARSKADVEAILQNDPFQKGGLADYEVIEFVAGKHNAALAAFL